MREALAGRAALRMVSEAVYELFGPVASLESETGTLWRGPGLHHRGASARRGRIGSAQSGRTGRLTRWCNSPSILACCTLSVLVVHWQMRHWLAPAVPWLPAWWR